jgi:hypothetical protein
LKPGGRPVENNKLEASTTTMTRTATERNFEGPYKELLSELASLIVWLQAEHDKSYVKAGDDKVYAYGGSGFVLVLDESVWDGLIELVTPVGALSVKPGDDGKVSVTSAVEGEAAVKDILRKGVDGLRTYYENRYWSTPTTAT